MFIGTPMQVQLDIAKDINSDDKVLVDFAKACLDNVASLKFKYQNKDVYECKFLKKYSDNPRIYIDSINLLKQHKGIVHTLKLMYGIDMEEFLAVTQNILTLGRAELLEAIQPKHVLSCNKDFIGKDSLNNDYIQKAFEFRLEKGGKKALVDLLTDIVKESYYKLGWYDIVEKLHRLAPYVNDDSLFNWLDEMNVKEIQEEKKESVWLTLYQIGAVKSFVVAAEMFKDELDAEI